MADISVKLVDLVSALARALDMVSTTLGDHHTNVGYVAASIARKLGLEAETQRDVLLAAMMHDAGALALHPNLDSLRFELDLHTHACAGKTLIETCPTLRDVATLVEFHHTPWAEMAGCPPSVQVANIINLADYVDVRVKRHSPSDIQYADILAHTKANASELFAPHYLEALLELGQDETFLNGLHNPAAYFYTPSRMEQQVLGTDAVLSFSNLFSLIIDFRCSFTATHSRGVADTARWLAKELHFDEGGQKLIYIAGLLHDIGKLGVPRMLLEHPGDLDKEQFRVVQQHALFSEKLLGAVPGLEIIANWGSQHHERVNGSGYPHGLFEAELSLGSRIIQVADVFTAIAEDRPYRRGMSAEQAKNILKNQAERYFLDAKVVSALLDNYDAVNALRVDGQRKARAEFDRFYSVVTNAKNIDRS